MIFECVNEMHHVEVQHHPITSIANDNGACFLQTTGASVVLGSMHLLANFKIGSDAFQPLQIAGVNNAQALQCLDAHVLVKCCHVLFLPCALHPERALVISHDLRIHQ